MKRHHIAPVMIGMGLILVVGLSALLVERETIDRKEFEAFMRGDTLPAPQETAAAEPGT